MQCPPRGVGKNIGYCTVSKFECNIYIFKHNIRNLMTELPQSRFTRGWCQMKGNNPYIYTIYFRFRYHDKHLKNNRITIFSWQFNMGKNFNLTQLGSSSDILSETLTRPIFTWSVSNKSSICLHLQSLFNFFQKD
jgi:hypothetical protein